jgi:hypothetical protein
MAFSASRRAIFALNLVAQAEMVAKMLPNKPKLLSTNGGGMVSTAKKCPSASAFGYQIG